MLEEFKKFTLRGNVVDLAVGVIIGAAFGAIVQSLVGDVIMPVVGAVTGGIDFSNYFIPLSSKVTATTLVEAKKQGAVLAWGNFLTIVINFLIIATVLFFAIRAIGRLVKKEAEKTPPVSKEEATARRNPRSAEIALTRNVFPHGRQSPSAATSWRPTTARRAFITRSARCSRPGSRSPAPRSNRVRAGKATIAESYADARGGEIWLINATIPEYLQAHRFNHAPKRPRKLLLHKSQINKLAGAVEREGMTIVPLKLYFNDKGRAKIEIALARGKKLHDKRETLKKRSWERERGRLMRAKG